MYINLNTDELSQKLKGLANACEKLNDCCDKLKFNKGVAEAQLYFHKAAQTANPQYRDIFYSKSKKIALALQRKINLQVTLN